MTITNKDSILKKYYELNGQQTMFGYDNLEFKTINHPTPHRFVELCPEFKLKKTKRSLIVNLPTRETDNVEVIATASTSTSSEYFPYREWTFDCF
tara:strand:+ start:309 stop:593 length:285 start_codon:yes stop_codon:yes gene_type:complete